MKRKNVLPATIIFLLLAGLIAYFGYTSLGENSQEEKPFYVGVTYGGNNTPRRKNPHRQSQRLHQPFVLNQAH
jgi:hypothetical protein